MPDKYFLGPGLVAKLGQMVTRFDGASEGGGAGARIPLRFEEPLRRSPPGGFKACRFSGAWGLTGDKVVTSISTGETFNATNLIFDIPNVGSTLHCVIGKDGTAWYLSNAQHQGTNVITRVAIEGSSLVFNAASVQVIGTTAQGTTFGLDVCDSYTNNTSSSSSTSSSGQAASFSATSYFFG